MDCDRLDDYIDGEMTPAEMAAFRNHLATCEACRTAEAAQRSLIEQLATRRIDRSPPRPLWDGIVSQIEASPAAEPTVGWWRTYALAAMILFALGAAAGMGRVETEATTVAWTANPSDVDSMEREIDRHLAHLEKTLDRDSFAVLTRNLSAIDEAIAEIEALDVPVTDQEGVSSILLATTQRKLEIVRGATMDFGG
ncbi:MAG: zf-HC2 domain-containing protein [Myxococcota bacterium]